MINYSITLLIYIFTYSYILVASLNFLNPITEFLSLLLIILSISLAILSSSCLPLEIFKNSANNKPIPRLAFLFFVMLFSAWIILVFHRPTIDTDANIYHLPLSILINHSIWYPGIGNLNSHFGFPNGCSVLASLFTSFNIVGFENITNLLMWALFGLGLFAYLQKKKVSPLFSLLFALTILFTPDIFWQSYNMGTDLPCAVFMTFGLLALYERKFYDAALLLAMSSVFKTLGTIAFILVIIYILFLRLSKLVKVDIRHPKIILSLGICLICLLRIYIATGNPFYPALGLKLAPWGVSADNQKGLMDCTRQYARVERTFLGTITFVKNFFFFPSKFCSSHWFSPIFITCFFSSIYICFKKKYLRHFNKYLFFITLLICILFISWFWSSPLVRFILGVLVFLNLIFFLKFREYAFVALWKLVVYGSLFFTLSLFVYNVGDHIKNDTLPLLNASEEKIRSFMPYYGYKSPYVKQKDGFYYSYCTSNFCSRVLPPCINRYSYGEEDALVNEYKKYNRRFR